MTGRVSGKRVLVTGAARGMGRSHAVRLAEEGADLMLVDICASLPEIDYPLAGTEDLDETADLVRQLGRRAVTHVVDVRDAAALTAAVEAGRSDDPRTRARLRRRIARGRRFAVGMHRASPVPADWTSWLAADTTVCRCEEVDAARVHATVHGLAADDPRDVRVTARPGMGRCQGRVCGFALSCLVTADTRRPADPLDLEPLAKRPLATPIRVADLAALADGKD